MRDNFFRLSSLVYIIGLAVWAYKIAPQDAGYIVWVVIAATSFIIISGGMVATSLEIDLWEGLTTGTVGFLIHSTPYIPWWPQSVPLSLVLMVLVSGVCPALYIGLLFGIEKVFSLMEHLASRCN